MNKFRIVVTSPRHAPRWPRTPWPYYPDFRRAMQGSSCEALAQRLDSVWRHPGLAEIERSRLVLAAELLTFEDRRLAVNGPDFERVERLVSELEHKYGEPIVPSGGPGGDRG